MIPLCVDSLDSDSEEGAPFRAVLLYEVGVPGFHSGQVADFFVGKLEPVFAVDTARWDIAEFEIGSLSTLSEDQSLSAEIVVISMRDGTGLSSSLRIWIHRWLSRRKGKRSVMIVLFDYPGKGTDFARRHLRSAAARAGVDFITQTGYLPPQEVHTDDLLLAV